MNLYKKRDIWWIDIRDNGKRIRKSLGTKLKKLAMEKATKWLQEYSHQVDENISLSQALEVYINYKKGRNTEKTIKNDLSRLTRFVHFIGEKTQLHQIKEIDIQKFITQTHEERELTNKGINNYIQNLKALFNYFHKRDALNKNPMKHISLLQLEETMPRYLAEEEIQEVCHLLKDRPYYSMVIFALYTGARVGEMIQLKWKNIDFKNGLIVIENEGQLKKTKSRKFRSIPMHKKLRELLERKWDLSKGYLPNKRVFSYTYYPNALGRYLKKRGYSSIGWHNFRHTFATTLYRQTTDLYLLKELLGHSDIKLTMRYARLVQDHAVSQMDKLNFNLEKE